MMYSRLILVTYVYACVVSVCCNLANGTTVSKRLRKMERKMKRLTNKVAILKQENAHIKTKLQSLMNATVACSINSNSSSPYLSNTSPQGSSLTPCVCTSGLKLNDGLKVKVTSLESYETGIGLTNIRTEKNYVINYAIDRIKGKDHASHAHDNMITSWVYLGDKFGYGNLRNWYEAGRNNRTHRSARTLFVPFEANSQVYLRFGNYHNAMYTIILDNFKNFSGTSTKEVTIPRFVKLPQEIVYSPGENITFNISVESDKEVFFETSSSRYYLVDTNTNTFIKSVSFPHYIELLQNVTENTSRDDGWNTNTNTTIYTWNITWDISHISVKGTVTGLVELVAWGKVKDHPVIKEVRTCKLIKLRPRNKVGHFPHGLFSFINDTDRNLTPKGTKGSNDNERKKYSDRGMVTSRGEHILYCSNNVQCQVNCNVVSGGRGAVEMKFIHLRLNRYTPKAMMIKRTSPRNSNQIYSFLFKVPFMSWTVSEPRYRCLATDIESGKHIVRNFVVKYLRAPRSLKLIFDYERSNKTLTVSCRGVGIVAMTSLQIKAQVGGKAWLPHISDHDRSLGVEVDDNSRKESPDQGQGRRRLKLVKQYDLESFSFPEDNDNNSTELKLYCHASNQAGSIETSLGPITLWNHIITKKGKGKRGRGKERGRERGREKRNKGNEALKKNEPAGKISDHID